MKKKVYVAVNYILYEGFEIVGVFSTMAKAKKRSEDVFVWHLDGDQYVPKTKKLSK